MNQRIAVVAALGAALATGCASAPGAPDRYPFEPASSVEETFRWHRNLATLKTAWWDVVGEQQAWYFKNAQQLFPSVPVYRAGPVAPLPRRPLREIAEHPVQTPSGTLRFADFLSGKHSTTMGLVILHKGEIVFEAYPRMEPYQKPIFWSVTKVFVSTVVAILEDRGLVDVDAPIEFYSPELRESQLAGIRVRDILDMASGLDCSDDYEDFEACYYRFETSLGDGFRTENSPDNPYDMLIDFDYGYWAEPGTGYDYSGVNTFLLGWLVEEVSGMFAIGADAAYIRGEMDDDHVLRVNVFQGVRIQLADIVRVNEIVVFDARDEDAQQRHRQAGTPQKFALAHDNVVGHAGCLKRWVQATHEPLVVSGHTRRTMACMATLCLDTANGQHCLASHRDHVAAHAEGKHRIHG